MIVSHTMLADGEVTKNTAVCIGRFDNTVRTAIWPYKDMMSTIIGLAMNNAGDGASVEVCIIGPITDLGFTFIRSKPIYIIDSGKLTQTMPDKYIYKIGQAIGERTILVTPSQLFSLES